MKYYSSDKVYGEYISNHVSKGRPLREFVAYQPARIVYKRPRLYRGKIVGWYVDYRYHVEAEWMIEPKDIVIGRDYPRC